jgi:hypothetical protein
LVDSTIRYKKYLLEANPAKARMVSETVATHENCGFKGRKLDLRKCRIATPQSPGKQMLIAKLRRKASGWVSISYKD